MSDNVIFTATVGTPNGIFTILADESTVLASGWTDRASLLDRLGAIDSKVRPTMREPVIQAAVDAIEAFYAGEEDLLCQVPVRFETDGFHRQVQEVLRETHIGDRITYSELAAKAGNPSAARAAASACSRNLTALFIPCHRAIRADGTAGQFAYGVELKESLLEREQRILAAGGPVRVESTYSGDTIATGAVEPTGITVTPVEPEIALVPAEPEVTEPAPAKPELVEPAPKEPEVAEPESTKPEVSEPEPAKPDVAQATTHEPESVDSSWL